MPCEGISSTSMNCSQQSWVDGSATISKTARKAAADARISQHKLELQQQCAFVTGTAFMRKLVDKLQRNYAAKLTEFHNCLATHFFHTYVRLHLNTPKDNGINVEDVAACAFWLALKSEQTVDGYACPLDTLVDVWHRVKLTNPWMDKNVPREHCDQFCAYFIQLERLLLCSNGFGFYVEFPHWLVLLTVPGLTGSDSKEDELLAASYYLCSDCLQMTMFGCEETPALMATACTILAAFWLDHQLWQLPSLICQAFEQTANQNVRKASPAKSRLQQLQGQTNNAGIECGGGGEISVNLAQAKYYASVLAQTHAAISTPDSPSILLKKMTRKPSRYGQIPFPASASALSPLSRLDTVSSPSCTSASSSGGCGGGGGTTTTTNDSRNIGIGSNQGNWVDSGIEA